MSPVRKNVTIQRFYKKNPNYCHGFSLIEILIAMFLSLLLFAVMIQSYLNAKNVYRAQIEIAYLNENIRIADFILWQHIMQAGFAGCRKISELNLQNHTQIDFGVADVIHGYDSSNLPSYLSGKVIKGTDVIVIAKAGVDSSHILSDVNVGVTAIKVAQNPATSANRLLLIADCKNADLFLAKNHDGNVIHAESSLSTGYKIRSAEVSRFEKLAFFISNSGRLDERGYPTYGLYFSTNHGNKRELVPGISDMQVYYGVAAKYLKAREVSDARLWDKVSSVLIELKMQGRLALNKKMYIKLRGRA